jgi:PAS domain S-box-containing protein
MPAGPYPPDDEQARLELDALRLHGHAASAPLGTAASLLMGLAAAWLVRDLVPAPALVAWLAALTAAVAWRRVLPWAMRRTGETAAVAARRWLPWHRWSSGAHGLAWGLVAWLPLALSDAQRLPALVVVLVGVAVGGMALLQFDPRAAALFAAGVLLPALPLLAGSALPLPPYMLMALLAGCLLIMVMALAGRRAEQERRALVQARRAERRSAQGARDAQSMLRQVFEHAGLGISVFDAGQRLVAWNDRVAQVTGLDQALLRPGLPLAEALENLWDRGLVVRLASAPDRASDIHQRLALLHQPVPTVSRERRTDGRLTETRRNPLPDGGFVMFHADITEREAARRAAAEQQRMLALVLEHTEQGFWSIDNDLRTTDANPAMCRLLGLERAQLLGRSIYDFVDPANRAVFEHNVALRAAGQAGSYEDHAAARRRPAGALPEQRHAAVRCGRPQGRCAGPGLRHHRAPDAEERARLASEALREKSRMLTWTLDSLSQGVLSVDAEGRCTAWNRRLVELLQLPPELMTGQPRTIDLLAWQLASGDFGPDMSLLDEAGRVHVRRVLDGQPSRSRDRYRRVRLDGTVLEIVSNYAEDGSLVRTRATRPSAPTAPSRSSCRACRTSCARR